MKNVSEKKDVYSIINEMIIAKLEQNIMPWKQAWNNYGPAMNYVSKKAYRGINAMVLNCTKSEYPYFVTFNQAVQLGGTIKKGAKGKMVVFWKLLSNKNSKGKSGSKITSSKDEKKIPLLRYYYVFNIDCVDGVEFKLPEKHLNHHPIEACENIVKGMPKSPLIINHGDHPHYNFVKDKIEIPLIINFTSEQEYYATLFHELAHSTGHKARLDRSLTGNKYSFEYMVEELIAESVSFMLCNEAGIASQVVNNTAAYIKHWLEKIKRMTKEDHRILVRAFTQAQRATDYILNNKEDEEVDKEESLLVTEDLKGV